MDHEIIHLGEGEIIPHPEDTIGLKEQVEGLLEAIRANESRLATSYARLGSLLLQVRKGCYWEAWGYKSFGQYIDSLRVRIDRGRSQIYAALSAADKLLPLISEQDLETVGISKAHELQRFVQQSGRNPANVVVDETGRTLLDAAKDDAVTVSQLHALVLEALHEKGEVKGTWFEFGGCYLLADEKKEILDAMSVTRRVEPPIDENAADHVQRKEIMLRWAREFAGTYAEEVNQQ